MFAIREKQTWVNEVPVRTFERQTADANTALRVEAGTTGFRGGNTRSRGGRTYIGLECLSGDFYFAPVKDDAERVVGFEIAVCGDAGLNAVVKALDFARTAIHDQCGRVND